MIKIIIVLSIFMLISCEELFSNLVGMNSAYNVESIDIESSSVVDIPDGWEIDKSGDYSSISWSAGFLIPSEGDRISFKDSAGIPIILEKYGSDMILSPDNPSAEFYDERIVLHLRENLELVFKRKK